MKKKGFTLIELSIALGLFTILSVFLFRAFSTQVREASAFNKYVDIQCNVNNALSTLTNEIRNNTNISLDTTEGSPAVQVLSNGKAIIDLASDSSSPDIYYDSKNKILYDKSGNHYSYINSINIVQGTMSDNENELIKITVTGIEGNVQFTSSTAINIRR